MAESPHSPQCIRFRAEDLALIRKAAERDDERVSPWIRIAVLARADLVLGKKRAKKLVAVPAGEEVRCIRFRKVATDRVQLAAKEESLSVAGWIRAVAVAAATAQS